MNRRTAYNGVKAFRAALTTATACWCIVPGAAWAQSVTPPSSSPAQEATASRAPTEASEIIVTGSRIARSGFTTPTPVTVLGDAVIARRAPVTIADTLNELPSFRPSATPSSQTQAVSSGANLADLRGLGPQRTLVLINGQRVVPSNISENVDLNLVPVSLLQRVDIVTGGALAAYGSDAVAGVVNLVLKRLDGFSADVQSGITEYGDNAQWKASFAYGTSFAGGRGHISIAGEYADSKGIRNQDSRPWFNDAALIANPAFTATNGQPARLITENAHLSGFTYNGLILAGPLRGTEFLPGGGTRQFQYGTSVGSAYMIGGDGINPSGSKPLAYPLQRNTIYVRPEYEFSDALKVSADLSWSHSETGGPSFSYPTGFTIQSDNAYLPDSVRTRMAAAGVTSFPLGRFTPDIGIFDARIRNNTYRGVLSLDGKLGGSWKWNAYYQYGQTNISNRTTGVSIVQNLNRAADAVVNPATGAIVCRSTLSNPTDGCVPLNVFGAGSPSAAAVNFVTGAGAFSDLTIRQHAAAASIQGDLLSTWAGPVTAVLGAEYRRESARQSTDPISAAGGYNVGAGLPIQGSFDVKEAFGEIAIPLAKDARFAKDLELNGAVRYTDYSTSGSVVTWKVGGSYAPTGDIRFRGTVSRDIRAPNIGELFASPTVQLFTATDPTRNNAQIVARQLIGGNTNLKAEKSDMVTAGVVLTPSVIPRLSLSADYYHLKIHDAIATLTGQQIIDRCNGAQPALCGLIVRDATGALVSVNVSQLNLSSITLSGVDLEARYTIPLRAHGKSLSFSGLATYLGKYDSSDGVTVFRQAGVVGTDLAASPHWRATATVTYDSDIATISAQGRYVGGGLYNAAYTATDINDNHVRGQFLVNLTGELRVPGHGNFSLYAVVNNLFNSRPPLDPGTFIYATSTNPMLYDVYGRTFVVGARVRF